MKTLRTIGLSLAVLLGTATPAYATTATDPTAKVEASHYWFQGNWFIDAVFVLTSVALVIGFCGFYWFKVLRPKFRGRPVE